MLGIWQVAFKRACGKRLSDVIKLISSISCETWWWWHHVMGLLVIAGKGRLVRTEGWKCSAVKYKKILEEDMLQSAYNLRVGWQFIFQHDNNTTETCWSGTVSDNVWMAHSKSPMDHSRTIEHLWRDLIMTVQRHFPSNLRKIEKIWLNPGVRSF